MCWVSRYTFFPYFFELKHDKNFNILSLDRSVKAALEILKKKKKKIFAATDKTRLLKRCSQNNKILSGGYWNFILDLIWYDDKMPCDKKVRGM